jgi:Universal stress protein UspA and related nucleotide-binding proteins
MFDRILVPTDGQPAMDRVYTLAAELATTHDAAVDLVYVVDDRAFLTLEAGMRAEVTAELTAEGEAALETAAASLEESATEVTTAMRQGSPAAEILAYADTDPPDLIVMGTRQAAYPQQMLGSVSHEVVVRADAPVLTVNLVAA